MQENGSNGGKVYKNNRVDELPKVSWAFESDSGTFSPVSKEKLFDIRHPKLFLFKS